MTSLREKLGVVSFQGLEVLQRMVDLGFKHFRLGAGWNGFPFDAVTKQYDFGWLDQAVNYLLENGCVPLLSLFGIPCWTDPENKHGRVGNLSPNECQAKFFEEQWVPEWMNFVRQIVSRYPQIVYWSVISEVNIPIWWEGTIEEFAMRVIYPAFLVICVEKNRLLIAPGVTIQPESKANFARAVNCLRELRKNAMGMIDHLAFHVYHDDEPESLTSDIERFLKTFKRFTKNPALLMFPQYYSKRPSETWPHSRLYITEFGYDQRSTRNFGSGENEQKRKYEGFINWWIADNIYAQWIACSYLYRSWSPRLEQRGSLLRPDYSPTPTALYLSQYLR